MAKKKRPAKRTRERAATTPRPPQPPSRVGSQPLSRALALLLAIGVIAALLLGGVLWFGRDGGGASLSDVLEQDPGPVHVHGLGINPADGALFIATHTGLWRAPTGSTAAERVGDSKQDTMGFSVVGPDRFLGSGHPDTPDLPPLLGLIESKDAGRTWTSISLLGEADFHVLRSTGRRVYGWDSSNERLMVSRNDGRKWTQEQAPGLVVDLAPHPANATRVVASTDQGLYVSNDEGRKWKPLPSSAVGLLAWPTAARLYMVDGAGGVSASRNGGRQWNTVGDVGGQPAAFMAHGTSELYAALHDGTVKRSADGGRSWSVRSRP